MTRAGALFAAAFLFLLPQAALSHGYDDRAPGYDDRDRDAHDDRDGRGGYTRPAPHHEPLVLNGRINTGDFDGGVGCICGCGGDYYGGAYVMVGGSAGAAAGASAGASASASASAAAGVSINTFIGSSTHFGGGHGSYGGHGGSHGGYGGHGGGMGGHH